jgi:hypothetical protein
MIPQQITREDNDGETRYNGTSMHYDSHGEPDNQTTDVGGWWGQYGLIEVKSG